MANGRRAGKQTLGNETGPTQEAKVARARANPTGKEGAGRGSWLGHNAGRSRSGPKAYAGERAPVGTGRAVREGGLPSVGLER